MELQGKGVSKGVVIGRIRYISYVADTVEKVPVDNPEAEIARYESATTVAVTQLGELAVETAARLGKQNSLLFEVHQMMLKDVDFTEAVIARIKTEKVTAEYAVSETAKEFSADFTQMDDTYMQARAADVLDVSRRVVEILTGKERTYDGVGEPMILAAEDFAPSETAQLERKNTLALMTAGGSSNSHTAIFARTMGIPAVIGLGNDIGAWADGHLCALNGETGEVIINPSDDVLANFRARIQSQKDLMDTLAQYRDKASVTKSGKKIKLFANISNVNDAKLANENGAEGVGLFRSEFLYLESSDYPDEDKQFAAYKAVAEEMGGKLVIIRTMDIGADKQAYYFNLPKEENPAMGLRAIRICLKKPDVFKTQLRAIYRASMFGKVAIMLPMIASLWELKKARGIAAEVMADLDAEGIAYDRELAIGIMIETPAAAIISDVLAQEADFFSIGTNDLTQYTLAVDRQNSQIDEFCDTHHEALLRLIKTVVDNAHANGIICGICGELGADASLFEWFMEMGVDEISVTPPMILPLRKQVCELM
jgi:phosphotransferase system enzyme I (PtsI)